MHHHHDATSHNDARAGGDRPSHDRHEGHTPEMFRDRLLLSLVLTIPVLYFSEQIQEWFGYTAVDFTGVDLVNPVLATILYIYAGAVFIRGAVHEAQARLPGMMTLITIAISVAYGYSLAVSLGLDGEPFYWELATLLDVMLLGHWIEMRSVQSAGAALEHLAAMVPNVAHRFAPDGDIADVDVATLVDGDRILIRPGEQVPADGVVVEGSTTMNEAFLTGESRPVAKRVGDEAVAGAVNGEGALTVEVTRTGDATTLSQIMRLVQEAQASRSRFQALADRAAFWLTIIAVGVAVPTFGAWLIVGSSGVTFAVARAVAVLVIACPHALGLAIPLVTVNATSVSARNGILVRNREAFERGKDIRFVAFDKTGTLTEGRFVVSHITGSLPELELLELAARLEQSSEHPLAAAVVAEARDRAAPLRSAENVTAVPGEGIEGSVAGVHYRIGRPEWATTVGVAVSGEISDAIRLADERGESAIVLMDDTAVLGVVSLADKIRESARVAIERLKGIGIEPIMITGDAHAVAATVAGELGIDRYYARVLPQDKARIVRELQDEGRTAFVGDGVNDAPALLHSDLGVAIGAGTNVAIESADLVLIDDDPVDVARALDLARATRRKMLQNLAWATGYNVVAIPLAAGAASGLGIVLSPAIGAVFMSASTVIVSLNAMTLRRIQV